MKTLLTKFFKSLTCKLMWAMVATASAAYAHDLPSDCPLAHDWGILQQDCMGVREARPIPLVSPTQLSQAINDSLLVIAPEIGEPPAPLRPLKHLTTDNNSITPQFEDFDWTERIDCSVLESQFRGYPLVEATGSLRKPIDEQSSEFAQAARVSESEFDRLYYGTRSCEFEVQSTTPSFTPRLAFDRTCVEDSIPLQFHSNRIRYMDYLNLDSNRLPVVDSVPLAMAIPVAEPNIEPHRDDQLIDTLLQQLATWQCIGAAELYDCKRAANVGSQLAAVSSKWIGTTIPHLAGTFKGLKSPATQIAASNPIASEVASAPITRPIFALYSMGNGETLAIPQEQAQQWKYAHSADLWLANDPDTVASSLVVAQDADAELSPEFREMMSQANARLKWAGGRLSQAAHMMNDWFSNRLARSAGDESLR